MRISKGRPGNVRIDVCINGHYLADTRLTFNLPIVEIVIISRRVGPGTAACDGNQIPNDIGIRGSTAVSIKVRTSRPYQFHSCTGGKSKVEGNAMLTHRNINRLTDQCGTRPIVKLDGTVACGGGIYFHGFDYARTIGIEFEVVTIAGSEIPSCTCIIVLASENGRAALHIVGIVNTGLRQERGLESISLMEEDITWAIPQNGIRSAGCEGHNAGAAAFAVHNLGSGRRTNLNIGCLLQGISTAHTTICNQFHRINPGGVIKMNRIR